MARRLHLITGLILLSYATTHLLNHALGLWSLEALAAGRAVFLGFWRSLPASLLLYGALILHFGSACRSLYRRRRLAMPPWEAAQIVLGFSIPPLLALHVLGTRFAHEVFGVHDSYVYVLLVYFVFSPWLGAKQVLVVVVAWLHACIGVHYWLRFRSRYRNLLPYLYAGALLVPAAALSGFLVAGRQVAALAQDPAWLEQAQARIGFVDAAGLDRIHGLDTAVIALWAATVALTLLARRLRSWRDERRSLVRIVYPGGRQVRVARGATILEASRGAGIPHASVCGGRGRCSTCRVRVAAGAERLPPPSEAEQRVLQRVGAAPNVRLACQTRPQHDVEVSPLLPAGIAPREALAQGSVLHGEEREVAILFADLRGFTALAEHKLPYDVVFVLNRYFAAMGTAVEQAGGRIDKFIGDGVMALFGVDTGVQAGCLAALAGARRMAEALAELNRTLAHDLDRPLRIAIGIHSGPVIVGAMGYRAATSVTAVGDAVNTASRLEGLSKELDVQLVVSEPVAAHAGVDLSGHARREIELRGRSTRLGVWLVESAQELPVAADADAPAPAATLRRRALSRRSSSDRPRSRP